MSEPLPIGTRVRHYGEQYTRARTWGTANIVGYFQVGGHLEYRVKRDQPLYPGAPSVTEWSSEMTIPVQPPTGSVTA